MSMIAVMVVALRSSTTNHALDVPRTRVLGKIQGTIVQTLDSRMQPTQGLVDTACQLPVPEVEIY